MATRMKRCSYVSDTESSSSEGHVELRENYKRHDNNIELDEDSVCSYRKTKRPTRNAIMARENRIKKKLYMQKLEYELKILRKDNLKLNEIVENQSFKIAELQRHVKYMKSTLANSADLRVLMKNIQCNTGMSVSTSVDKTLTLKNDYVPKRTTKIADESLHPWNEQLKTSLEADCETIPSVSFSEIDIFDTDPFPNLFDFETLNDNTEAETPMQLLDSVSAYNEHNYTRTSKYLKSEDDNAISDVGVCLHVSKHRVSLEFCSTCSENATETWKTVE